PAIDDDERSPCRADFDAMRVSAITNCRRSGLWYRTARAPKLNLHQGPPHHRPHVSILSVLSLVGIEIGMLAREPSYLSLGHDSGCAVEACMKTGTMWQSPKSKSSPSRRAKRGSCITNSCPETRSPQNTEH